MVLKAVRPLKILQAALFYTLLPLTLIVAISRCDRSAAKSLHLLWIQNPKGNHRLWSELRWHHSELPKDAPVFFTGSGQGWGDGWYSHMAKLLNLEDSSFKSLGISYWANSKLDFKVLELGGRLRRAVRVGIFLGAGDSAVAALPTRKKLGELRKKHSLDGFVLLLDAPLKAKAIREQLIEQKGAGYTAIVLTQEILAPQEFGAENGFLGMAIPTENEASHLFHAELGLAPKSSLPQDNIMWNWSWVDLKAGSHAPQDEKGDPILFPLQEGLRKLFNVNPSDQIAVHTETPEVGAPTLGSCLLLQSWQAAMSPQVAPIVMVDSSRVTEPIPTAQGLLSWLDLLDLYPWGFDQRQGKQSSLILWDALAADLVLLGMTRLATHSQDKIAPIELSGVRMEWVKEQEALRVVRTMLLSEHEGVWTERELGLTERVKILMPLETFQEVTRVSLELDLNLDLTQWTLAQSEPSRSLVEQVRLGPKYYCKPWHSELEQSPVTPPTPSDTTLLH